MTGTPPDRFAYLPFGVGARVCIGAHFALVEATLALAKIIAAFRVDLVDKEPVMPIGVVTTQPDRSPMFAHHAAMTAHRSMSNTQAQFSVLRQTADPAVVDAISKLIEKGEDRDLNRINLLDFAARHGLDEEKVISAFLHSARLGLFDLSWNVLCPGCGGVLGRARHAEIASARRLQLRALREGL